MPTTTSPPNKNIERQPSFYNTTKRKRKATVRLAKPNVNEKDTICRALLNPYMSLYRRLTQQCIGKLSTLKCKSIMHTSYPRHTKVGMFRWSTHQSSRRERHPSRAISLLERCTRQDNRCWSVLHSESWTQKHGTKYKKKVYCPYMYLFPQLLHDVLYSYTA